MLFFPLKKSIAFKENNCNQKLNFLEVGIFFFQVKDNLSNIKGVISVNSERRIQEIFAMSENMFAIYFADCEYN